MSWGICYTKTTGGPGGSWTKGPTSCCTTIPLGFVKVIDTAGNLSIDTASDAYTPQNVALLFDRAGACQTNNVTLDDGAGAATFQTVNAGFVYLESLLQGTLTSPPGNLTPGQLWLDTTDSTDQPIVRCSQVIT